MQSQGNLQKSLSAGFRPYLQLTPLYDPAKDEWDHSMLISETIVPWTLDWLACYELWLMTGRWTGGGRHPEMGRNEELEV